MQIKNEFEGFFKFLSFELKSNVSELKAIERGINFAIHFDAYSNIIFSAF